MSSGLAFERAAMPCDEPSPMVAVRVACVQNERRGVLEESDEKGEASWIERMKAERGGSLCGQPGLSLLPRHKPSLLSLPALPDQAPRIR